jgi:sporulation protein YlmC with PRC-barrel domain
MTHCGNLGNQTVSEDIRDFRGTTVRGADGKKLGEVEDVIFDHDTMAIRYLVVDSVGWLEAGTFLLPADLVYAGEDNEAELATGVTRQQIADSPQYDKKTLEAADEWKKYEQEFRRYWDEEPVMHRKDSYRIVTPPDEEISAATSSIDSESGDSELDVASLFPERMSPVFSDPDPSSRNVRLRPKSVARAEDAASGVALLKPRWWDAFENYLRTNKDEIQEKCSQCGSKAA